MEKEYDFSKAERGRMHTPFTASSVRTAFVRAESYETNNEE
jgi:hypothetical protein